MADNKFLTRLKGKQIAKSSVQIDNDKLSPVFGDMPVGSDGLENIIQQSNSSTVVAKGAQNWYLSGDSMVLSDNDQYVSEFKVSGQGLWVNSSYELTSNMVIAPHSKWVLRFCGDNLLNSAGHKVSISVLIKTGTTTLASKSFMLEEQANFFCKVLEFDFDNTYESICKILSGASLTVQVLCGDENASATIYNGKTTLTLLQRMVDADTVAFNGTSLVDIMAGYIPEDYFNRYQEQVEDGAEAQAVFTRDGDNIDLSGWEDKASDQVAEHNTSEEAHADIRTELAGKQAQLTAGQNIVIDENNVISATGEISVAFESITGSPYDNANLTTALNAKADESDLQTHIEDKTNPHEVTKAQVGLGNVDNTADLDKPISTATQTALNAKQDTLVAGTNIQIAADGKTISATDTTYTAGTGIDITNNVISNTQTSAEWGNITGDIEDQTDLQTALDLKANSADLATVATSGSYNDLEDKPTIPAAQVNSDWNAVSGVAQILNKPTLATVATSGSYNDLTNKPTIPTKTSDLTNDSDYQTGTQVNTAISTHNSSSSAHSDIRTAVAGKSTVSVSATGTATEEVKYITIDGVEKKLAGGSGGGSEEDNISITKNDDDKIQTVGTINQNDNTEALKEWKGTLAEYEALAVKDDSTKYYITDDQAQTTSYTKAEADALLAHKLGDNRISNCITEIPQDIKLELSSDGTLTLKAGSKLYMPNGAGVFDVVNITSDKTRTGTATTTVQTMFFWDVFANGIRSRLLNSMTSGGSAPTVFTNSPTWYDTTNNKIKFYNTDGTIASEQGCLPLCVCTANSSGIQSIDQVFNGFGYIGSTIFALPGVKGLIPNGRNADGSLKNSELNFTSVTTKQVSGTNNALDMLISSNYIGTPTNGYKYNEQENYNYIESTQYSRLHFGKISVSSGQITSFTPKTAFHALDYNDSEYIGHNAMPSATHISLTTGASGTTYTAPADGYFAASFTLSSAAGYGLLRANEISAIATRGNASATYCYLPISKGTVCTLSYNNSTVGTVLFIYAEGSK